jgi:NADH-ubiquinone reductase complex 1 MLRQ subunit
MNIKNDCTKNSATHYMGLGSRRYFATKHVTEPGKPPSFKQSWLSDPSTYPIMVVLGFAVSMCCAFMYYKFTRCDDVRVTSKAKGQVLRTWADEK